MIFLSYSWKDQAAAHSLDSILRGHGLDVWIDFRDLNLRLDIANQLETAIRCCSLFVAFHPPKKQNTPWTMAELTMATEYARPIVRLSANSVTLNQLECFRLFQLAVGNRRNTNETGPVLTDRDCSTYTAWERAPPALFSTMNN